MPSTIAASHELDILLPGDAKIHYQLSPEELVDHIVKQGKGDISDSGAVCISTGAFTGRSPQDKFIVKDDDTSGLVEWNGFNKPMNKAQFLHLRNKMMDYLGSRDEVWIRDCFACARIEHRLHLRVINEDAAANLFCYNMFLRPELPDGEADWLMLQAPGFTADPATDGTRSPQFVAISFEQRCILIGGTGYTGEMKKSVFTVLNYLLPAEKKVLSMHCSANVGPGGDTAVFFGLSGTGKTTLSADPGRQLVGDDEHGWDDMGIFNFEGGCYAKIIDLQREKEPAIFDAITDGALVENTLFKPGSRQIDYSNNSITDNIRVSYPIHFIPNVLLPSSATHPRHIFFLTCDAYGVLPPVSRLSTEQAMYHFINGYTAKIAGTETGVKEPKATFSACFGAPFLPLPPRDYAMLLKKRLEQFPAQVWLVNTGWTGGSYGTGNRIPLHYTRSILSAVLDGRLEDTRFVQEPWFRLSIPVSCPGVPDNLLNPFNTWSNKQAYVTTALQLVELFRENHAKYQ